MKLNCVIDISHHQSDVDWAKVKASGIMGVIHKASEGSSYEDPLYDQHRKQANAAGLFWGAYHLADNSDASAQAALFLRASKPDKDTLLAIQWLDMGGGGSSAPETTETSEGEMAEGKQVEGGSPGTLTAEGVRQFVTLVHAQTNRYPGVCSGSVAKMELGDKIDPVLKNCWFWVVQYSDHPTDIPKTFDKCMLWQYTDGVNGPEPHDTPGVGACFRDAFNGEDRELEGFWTGSDAADVAVASKVTSRDPKRSDR